jgi:hypothetical protein
MNTHIIFFSYRSSLMPSLGLIDVLNYESYNWAEFDSTGYHPRFMRFLSGIYA